MSEPLAETADPGHLRPLLAAVSEAPARCGQTRVVAIDGPSGSGKSTLALALASALDCALVRMDDFYPGWDGLVAGITLLIERVLDPLCRGEDASVPTWDWVENRPAAPLHIAPTDLLVVDGVGSTVGAAGRRAALRVWVEAPQELRRARAIGRDGDGYAPFWDRWAAQEQAVFAADRTRSRAELVIDTSDL